MAFAVIRNVSLHQDNLQIINQIRNKPISEELHWPIKALQHMNFCSEPRPSTYLHLKIETTSQHARVKALSWHAKKSMQNSKTKYTLEKVAEINASQIDEALNVGCIQTALQLSQKLSRQQNIIRTPFPHSSEKNEIKNNIDAWAISASIVCSDDIPREIIHGIKPTTLHRHTELVSSVLSSVTITFHQKFAILNTELTNFQVDSLIDTLTNGNNTMAKICSPGQFLQINTPPLIHIVLMCSIYYNGFIEIDEQNLLSSIASSIGQKSMGCTSKKCQAL